MSLRGRALLYGYPALELMTLWLLMQWIGWGWAVLVFLGGIPFGLALMGSAGRAAVEEQRIAWASGMPPTQMLSHAARFACGLLLAIPGVWTDLAALAVLVPAAQRFLLRQLQRAGAAAAWTANGRITVIRSEVRRDGGGMEGPPQAPADQRGGAWSAGAIEGPAASAE